MDIIHCVLGRLSEAVRKKPLMSHSGKEPESLKYYLRKVKKPVHGAYVPCWNIPPAIRVDAKLYDGQACGKTRQEIVAIFDICRCR